MKQVREEMIKKGADLMVVTAADEVAWLLNLRGSDAENTPGWFVLFFFFHQMHLFSSQDIAYMYMPYFIKHAHMPFIKNITNVCINCLLKMFAVFRGYVIVNNEKGVELFVPGVKITPTVDLHLKVNQCDDECTK